MKRIAIALTVALAVAGCGDSNDTSSSTSERPALIVSAASSLRDAFASYGKSFDQAKTHFAFGGSDELAAQIRAGGKVDVFAAANAKLPDALHAEGKVGKPVVFTANRLVLAVPAVIWWVAIGKSLLNTGTTGRWYGPVATTTWSASRQKASVRTRKRPDGA